MERMQKSCRPSSDSISQVFHRLELFVFYISNLLDQDQDVDYHFVSGHVFIIDRRDKSGPYYFIL
jgi:hypothetical protein